MERSRKDWVGLIGLVLTAAAIPSAILIPMHSSQLDQARTLRAVELKLLQQKNETLKNANYAEVALLREQHKESIRSIRLEKQAVEDQLKRIAEIPETARQRLEAIERKLGVLDTQTKRLEIAFADRGHARTVDFRERIEETVKAQQSVRSILRRVGFDGGLDSAPETLNRLEQRYSDYRDRLYPLVHSYADWHREAIAAVGEVRKWLPFHMSKQNELIDQLDRRVRDVEAVNAAGNKNGKPVSAVADPRGSPDVVAKRLEAMDRELESIKSILEGTPTRKDTGTNRAPGK